MDMDDQKERGQSIVTAGVCVCGECAPSHESVRDLLDVET
jgi:hypothetical protein